MNGEELLPFAEVKLVDRGNGLDSGIGDEDIDPAERRDSLCDAIRRRCLIGDVDGDADRPLGTAKLGGGRVGASLVEVGDDDFGALPRKQRRDPLADAARRAGDNRYFIFKLHPVLQFSPQFFGQDNRRRPCRDPV